MNILLIDDDPLQLKATRLRLEALGHGVRPASGGAAALELARETPEDLDVILSDVLMPGLDGFALCEEIRRDQRLRSIPIVLVSANYSEPEDLALAASLGASSLICRTDSEERLEDALAKAVAQPTRMPTGDAATRARIAALRRQRQLEMQAERTREQAWRIAGLASELDALRGLADGRPCMLWGADAHGTMAPLRLADGSARRLGVVREAMIGKLGERTALAHPDDREGFAASWTDMLHGDVPLDARVRFPAPDGTWRVIEERAIAVTTPSGDRIIRGVSSDVTRVHDLELELIHSQRLETAGRLAGGIAHDFNNMLTVVLAGCEVLRETTHDEDELHWIGAIEQAGRDATSLSRQLLAFTSKRQDDTMPTHVSEVLSRQQKMLSRLLGAGIEVVADWEPRLPPVALPEGELVQVVMNLAVNARDAMSGRGRLEMRATSCVMKATGGRAVKLVISDTGAGMDEATLARVFEPYFTTKLQGRGTGIGMTTVREIVQRCGGTIAVRSSVGEGTTIEIILPGSRSEARPADLHAPDAHATPARTVLLVEDDESVRRALAAPLRERGWTVLEAGCLREAVFQAASARDLDALVTDLALPGPDGAEVAEVVRRTRPSLPVVYMSGHRDGDGLRDGVKTAPGVTCLSKPLTPTRLAEQIERALSAPGEAP